jgi:hypothetical protein
MKRSKKIITRLIQSFFKKFFMGSFYPSYIFFKTRRNFKKKINQKKQVNKYSNNLDKINENEFKITSQNNEDGIIHHIFKKIPSNKFFIEIGFGYYEFNSLNLIKEEGWNGRLIDVDQDESLALKKNLNYYYPLSKIEIINTKVTKTNIHDLTASSDGQKIDFFSIDIDSYDYWILKEMNLSNINVLCCEYNHWIGKKKLTIPYNEKFKFCDNGIWGASLLALTELLKLKNFSLIAVESSGTNAFFINNRFADKFEVLSPETSFRSVGRFYNDNQKKQIFDNVKNNFDKLIEL